MDFPDRADVDLQFTIAIERASGLHGKCLHLAVRDRGVINFFSRESLYICGDDSLIREYKLVSDTSECGKNHLPFDDEMIDRFKYLIGWNWFELKDAAFRKVYHVLSPPRFS
jgi:hypothetical protein